MCRDLHSVCVCVPFRDTPRILLGLNFTPLALTQFIHFPLAYEGYGAWAVHVCTSETLALVRGWCGSSSPAWRSDTEGQGLNTQGLKAGRLKEIDDVDKNTLHLGLFSKHTGRDSQTHLHTSNKWHIKWHYKWSWPAFNESDIKARAVTAGF